jgi:SpoIID/LytB domain protein
MRTPRLLTALLAAAAVAAPLTQAAAAPPAVAAASLPATQPGAEVVNRPTDGVFKVTGGGFGHGIGMSQYGAHGAGSKGLSHRQILAFYYPGTSVETRSAGTIAVGITTDNDGVTRVMHRPGLAVTNGPGGTARPLPAGFTQWRVSTATANANGCTLQGRDSSGTWKTAWPSGVTQACPVTFSNATDGSVDLVLPSGTVQVYRGKITATYRGSTSLLTVNHVPVQSYLRSVVPAEMPTSFHAEALKAQAVAARTYALRRSGGTTYYDTCDTTACQVYRGRGTRTATGLSSLEYPATDAAVAATDGQVLTYRSGSASQLALTMFSSANGGYTAPGGQQYLVGKADPYDAASPRSSWTGRLPASALQSAFGIDRVERVQILARDGAGKWGGRITKARVEGFTQAGAYRYVDTTGEGLRAAYPWPANGQGISSSYFTLAGAAPATPAKMATRIAGSDRYATAALVAQGFTGPVPVVYVVSGQDYPDALAAAAAAGHQDAPVLLTRSSSLPAATAQALTRLAPKRIVVVGGPAAVSAAVLAELAGYTTGPVERVSGANRYATAAAVAAAYPAGLPRVYLASGEGFADSLSGAALAGHEGAPLLLTRSGRLDTAARRVLEELAPGEVVLLGGPVALSPEVEAQVGALASVTTVRRVAGPDRYATAAAVAGLFPAGARAVYLASGQDYPDALVGAAVAGSRGVPVLLTSNATLRTAAAGALDRVSPKEILALGGVLTDEVRAQAGAYLP